MSDQRMLEAIESHTEVLRKILNDSVGQARQYLFLTNSGAAVALMAFMGSSRAIRNSIPVWVGLGFFVLGIISTGIFNLADYYARQGDFRSWLEDIDRLARHELIGKELFERLNRRIEATRKWIELLAISAFVFFVLGTGVSIVFASTHLHPSASTTAKNANSPAPMRPAATNMSRSRSLTRSQVALANAVRLRSASERGR